MSEVSPAEPETPWAVAKRMKAEGHPTSLIAERLRAMGLDDSDLVVLLHEAPPPASDEAAQRAIVAAGVGIVAGPLGRALMIALNPPEKPPPPTQVPLDAADPSARCAWHPTLASVANCPRCGAFTCHQCAPRADETVCANCRGSVSERDRRITRVARWLSLWMFGVALAAILQTIARADGLLRLGSALPLAVSAGPFVVLACVQLAVRTLWPTVVAVPALGVAVLLIRVSPLWIAMAVVLLIAALLGRSEVKAARRACTSV